MIIGHVEVGTDTGRRTSLPSRTRADSAGLVGAEATARTREASSTERRRVAVAALLFVSGFSAVFVAGVLLVLGVSDWLVGNELVLQRIGGAVTIAMGLVFLGFVPALQRDVRFHHVPQVGPAGAPVLGAVYGLGWTPCLGPTLTGVIALATGTQVGSSTIRGLALVLACCAGLGAPFVLIALGTRWAVWTAGWMRRHTRGPQVCGGVMLLALGTLLVTGAWGGFVAWLRGPIAAYTLPL
ncbi:cytochrome c biogenesis protein CcdA [Pseudonocardia sp. KRD-184]|uniref:Cytochrome c biogenesis protein CcdA n=1 Tax=Pseudonocardia oceani TaxID=2792013 RepID=A0ABS6U380_9PSEU|nr:cytochrome c biogenesis CcdA family protein [Pseudonocardia oceani]MBW0088716.1 cytochrome c biogenesis protein CcdA [Pseudonocardia oceani]MBW0095655.1 cytochrome c biogenesis protein CcdA [Pseudonocardia oceani]MBW0121840.1 cytochrome c biogenesis protein CcdA [Pseudonocardia oceani]MBW0126604.1 cytochrome c biogenesis protein CcdA [Pseudonocardia oceani]